MTMRSPEAYAASMEAAEQEEKKAREKRLRNVSYWDQTINGNDAEALAELREFGLANGLTPERFDAIVAMRRLRHAMHERMDEAMKVRMNENPTPDDEENNLGAFRENIEPHVLPAVLAMRHKGYQTMGSGFSLFDKQEIYFNEPLSTLKDDVVKKGLEACGAVVDESGKSISFVATAADTSDTLKERWNAIAAAMPDMGSRAPKANSYVAQFLRATGDKNQPVLGQSRDSE